MIMATVGYVIYCIITLWVCAGAFIMTMFSNGVKGKIAGEVKVIIVIALAFLYGVYGLWPYNELTLAG